jgi:hypothetical protein
MINKTFHFKKVCMQQNDCETVQVKAHIDRVKFVSISIEGIYL